MSSSSRDYDYYCRDHNNGWRWDYESDHWQNDTPDTGTAPLGIQELTKEVQNLHFVVQRLHHEVCEVKTTLNRIENHFMQPHNQHASTGLGGAEASTIFHGVQASTGLGGVVAAMPSQGWHSQEECLRLGLHRVMNSDGTRLSKIAHPTMLANMNMALWSWTSSMEARGMGRLMAVAHTTLSQKEAAWAAQGDGKKLFVASLCCRRCGIFIEMGAHQGRYNEAQERELAYFLMLEDSAEMQVPVYNWPH